MHRSITRNFDLVHLMWMTMSDSYSAFAIISFKCIL
ncbi:hypothetical protein Taro_002293 [Colocasia esculenta]|uniref:Uncharacterized protein n=1 Tax=Colocasia esculenta TaxID=4460 RepID=A0A843TIE0_COLES|nr:hypothetical protein [Colocasia esculenta]